MATDTEKASQQPNVDASTPGSGEITYPDYLDLEKEGNRKWKGNISGKQEEITLKEAFDKFVPMGGDYYKKSQKLAGLYKKYGTENPDELVGKIYDARDREYAQMAKNAEYHQDFVDMFGEAGFELKINKKGEGKIVDKETGKTLTEDEMAELDPQTQKLLQQFNSRFDQLGERMKGIEGKVGDVDERYQAIVNKQEAKALDGEVAQLKAKYPNITEQQIGLVKILASVDSQIAYNKSVAEGVEYTPKPLSQVYTELNESFGGKPMSQEEIDKIKKDAIESVKKTTPTEGAGTGSPAGEEKLPQNRAEFEKKMLEREVPINFGRAYK